MIPAQALKEESGERTPAAQLAAVMPLSEKKLGGD